MNNPHHSLLKVIKRSERPKSSSIGRGCFSLVYEIHACHMEQKFVNWRNNPRNFFCSWIFSGSSEATEPMEDLPKNYSCLKNVTTYFATQANILENGTTECNKCNRSHVVASVPKSNLFLVVVNASCGKCAEPVPELGIPGEPTKITLEAVTNACKEPGYRKRPKRCFVSTDPETGYMCGVGSISRASFRQVIAVQFWIIIFVWTSVGFLWFLAI